MEASRKRAPHVVSPLAGVSPEALVDYVGYRHFKYFQNNQHKDTGMILDRSNPKGPASVASVGFALAAYACAAEAGWVSYRESLSYATKTLTTLAKAPQADAPEGMSGYRGFFYHFVDPATGARATAPKFWNSELSTIDTALLMAGVRFAANYFRGRGKTETTIRRLADELYKRVEWDWMIRDQDGKQLVLHGWTPEAGIIPHVYEGYSEALLMYILAMGSPTHPAPASAWTSLFKDGRSKLVEKYGISYHAMPSEPLFCYQYPHCFIDFRGIFDPKAREQGFDWFENSRRMTYIHMRYAIDNPKRFRQYSRWDWGLTACDGPGGGPKQLPDGRTVDFRGYSERGAVTGFDDGTIAPTAAVSSLPFAPEIVLPTIEHWLRNRPEIMSDEGFYDAFNPTYPTEDSSPSGWIGHDRIGIDQGPVVLMLENWRSGLVWDVMRQDPFIRKGLEKAGFTGGWLVGDGSTNPPKGGKNMHSRKKPGKGKSKGKGKADKTPGSDKPQGDKLSGDKKANRMPRVRNYKLPKGFQFGAATSAFQIEGALEADGRGKSIWDDFLRQPKSPPYDLGDVACDHYNRYADDVKLMGKLGLDAYRFSIAWPRVVPEGNGRVNQKGLDFYDRLVDKLLAKGIEPYATLYHWDLPEWAQKQHAGWFGRDTALAFADYTAAVVKRLGDRVGKFATLNEPEVIIAGYAGDGMAPAFNRPDAGYRVGHHLLLGHALAAQAMRAARNDLQCGIVLNLVPIDPSDPQSADAKEHAHKRYVKSYTWYLDALLKGHYPEEVLKELARPDLLNPIQPLDMSLIAQRLDFLGINYYTRFLVDEAGEMVFTPEEPKTQMGWEIHPDSLSQMLIDLHKEYPLPPTYITENGAALDDTVCGDGRVHDVARTRYLHQHIKAVAKAARAGVPMKGYFVWSLMDNLEWPLGFAKTFGIVHVDRKTLARTVKDSGRWYAKVIRKNTGK